MADQQDQVGSLAQVIWAKTVTIVGILFFLAMVVLVVSNVALVVERNHLLVLASWVWTWLGFAVGPMAIILWLRLLSVGASYRFRLPHKQWYGGILAVSCLVLILVLHFREYAIWGLPMLCAAYIAQGVLDTWLPPKSRKTRAQRNSSGRRTKARGKSSVNLAKKVSVAAQAPVKGYRAQYQDRKIPFPSTYAQDVSRVQNITSSKRSVMIWNSSADRKYVEEFHKHLHLKEQQGIFDLWDFTCLQPGDRWQEKKTQAIMSAEVIVLAVSANFLGQELPQFRNELEYARRCEALPLVLYIHACDLSGTGLESYLPLNLCDKALARLLPAERAEVFNNIVLGICQQLRNESARRGA